MCRQTHSTLITPTRKLEEIECILERLLWAVSYTNKLEQFGGRANKQEKDRTSYGNKCSEAERMLIHQASQTNTTLHNLFWKAEKKIWSVSPVFSLKKPLNLIKAKRKCACDWTALDDDCHWSPSWFTNIKINRCLLHNREKCWEEQTVSSNFNYLTPSIT